MNGWIKLHTKILNWGWYTDIPVMKLWINLLLRANWKANEWQGEVIPKGSLVTSVSKLSIETGLTIKQVRLALSKLEKTGEITVTRTNKYTLIKVEKWEEYQGMTDDEGKQTDTQRVTQTDTQRGSQRATNEEYKKRRINNKSPFIPPTVEEVEEYCNFRKNNVNPKQFYDYYTEANWVDGKGNKVKNWKQKVITWERNNKTVPREEDHKMVYPNMQAELEALALEEEWKN